MDGVNAASCVGQPAALLITMGSPTDGEDLAGDGHSHGGGLLTSGTTKKKRRIGSARHSAGTARSVEDEPRNAELNGNRNPEWWGDSSQLQIQIKQKFQFEFEPQDTLEFKSNQNLNSTLYREIPRI